MSQHTGIRLRGQPAGMLLDQLRAIGYRTFCTRTANCLEEYTERLLEGYHFRNVFCFRQRPDEFPIGHTQVSTGK